MNVNKIAFGLTAVLSWWLTGCSSLQEHTFTGKLWQNGELIDHYEPATNANVRLFQKDAHSDVLVLYDEEHERTGKIQHRAYFLAENEKKIEHNKKPHFVDGKLFHDMQAIPFVDASATNDAPVTRAESYLNGGGFKLLHGGEVEGAYKLPVYVDMKTEAKRVLLTPATVTFDVTGAGVFLGVVWLYANAPGLGH